MIPDNIISGFDQYNPSLKKTRHTIWASSTLTSPYYLLVYEMKANENTNEYSSGRMFMYINSSACLICSIPTPRRFIRLRVRPSAAARLYAGCRTVIPITRILFRLSPITGHTRAEARIWNSDLNATTKYTIAQDKKTALYWAALKIQVPGRKLRRQAQNISK